MHTEGAGFIYPEWYRIEKQAEKVVGKLATIRELTGYIRNPDENIRRIAIKRLGELKLKDSIPVLTEIIEDHLETRANCELAAWVLKCICRKWVVDPFTSSSLMDRFSGNEKYEDLFGVRLDYSENELRLGRDIPSVFSDLKNSSREVRLDNVVMPDMEFPYRKWISAIRSSFIRSVKKAALVPLKLLLQIPMLFIILFKALLPAVKNTFKREKIKKVKRYKPQKSYYGYQPQTNLMAVVFKKIALVISFPFRMLFKYRTPVFLSLIGCYLVLSLTHQGNWAVYRLSGIDLSRVNSTIVASVSELAAYAVNEVRDITGSEAISSKSADITNGGNTLGSGLENPSENKTYTVTAKSGLNLRKKPDPKAQKVTEKVIPFSTQVMYLSKSINDASGRLWYFIRTPDGSTGWVNAKWLAEGGLNN